MYYREKWINGWLFFKTEPKGEWQRVSLEQYRDRCLNLVLTIPLVSVSFLSVVGLKLK